MTSFPCALFLLNVLIAWCGAPSSSTSMADPCSALPKPPDVTYPGDLQLIGLFDLHEGIGCRFPRREAVEQLFGAQWALQKINNRSITGGVKIGLTAYDTCSNAQNALKRTITSLAGVNYFDSLGEMCRTKHVLGFLGPSRISPYQAVSSFLTQLNVSHLSMTLKSLTPEIEALVSVLSRLDWLHVALIASDESLEQDFLRAATKAQICVSISHVMNKYRGDFQLKNAILSINKSGVGAVVILGYDFEVKQVLRTSREFRGRQWHWLAAGPSITAGQRDPELQILWTMSEGMIVARSLNGRIPEFTRDFRKKIRESSYRTDHGNVFSEYAQLINLCSSNKTISNGSGRVTADPLIQCMDETNLLEGPGAMEAVQGVFRYAEAFRGLLQSTCPETMDFCPSLTMRLEKKMHDLLRGAPRGKFEDIFREANNKQAYNVSILAFLPITRKGRNFEFIPVGQYYNGHLYLDTPELGIIHPVGSGWFRIPEFRCRDISCGCINKEVILPPEKIPPPQAWRRETWVTISVTIAATGTVMALAILIYIIVKICRRDAVEGCQGMAIVLLGGVMSLYAAVLPFAFAPTEVVCAIQISGLGVSYAMVFGPMLTRCLVLVTSDTDGLPGHISGLIQSFLCFFMIGVQLAFATTYWWQKWGNHLINTTVPGLGGGIGQRCAFGTGDVVASLAYPAFLLAVLFISSPFCVRNRRNYREGLLFHIASLVSLGVWIGWLLPFFAFSRAWQEPSICLGLVANASAILITVFVPRVYKMATAYALDTATVSLRPIGLTSASLTDVTARGSNNLIYESVNHAYASEPTIHTIKTQDHMTGDITTEFPEECTGGGGHPKVTHL